MDALGPLLAALALAHPGHGGEAPACYGAADLCPLEQDEGRDGGEAHLARLLLDRGMAREAVRTLFRRAQLSAEAARLLGEALERLGDERGAANARERAARLEAQSGRASTSTLPSGSAK